ncbi:MAG: FecR domain-containing protein [Bryobacteraceae bacterium]
MNTSVTTFIRHSCWALVLIVPAWSQTPGPPQPGSINYVEGQASIGTNSLTPGSIGSVVLAKDQILTTQAGKVEVLLTPGVFLRVAENSSVKMVSPELANTKIELQKGRALVEVIQIRNENDTRIDQNGASTKLLKSGLYDFDADHAQVRVFKGKAEVYIGSQKVTLTERREVTLNASGVKPKSQGFEPRQFQDEFYRWCGLRSGYLSEASVDAARVHIGAGPGWYGPAWVGFGWYWDPWFGVYTFLPAEGIFYGAFGWGFYSPIAVYRSPFLFRPGYPHRFEEFHYPYGHGFAPPGRGGERR